ncbi:MULTISPECIES: SDR family oxidoreductase [Streptomyces]|uniref:SDR family oxidoreductase n=1 Tax=Streptomyces griseiscabiei TaxID=2993540 RepID=A0ABU4L226_9ACTN|nr:MULTISPECIES: SDR family oxidoreductase [Streptomyces]MBZ3906088.1 SDR family oxidoreductase [Streptomyces griseiscabiei]MDX2909722.1 SDR family oxidoreductase [Streptomyces griseiscabiei]
MGTTVGRLSGRTALVTGGSRGIGKAVATRLAAEGALVAVHYGHDAVAAEETVGQIAAAGGRAFAVHAELGVPGDAATLWEAFDAGLAGQDREDGLDILVNNAGITLPVEISKVTEAEYDRVFAINTKAPFFVVQQALGRMRDGGRIVNISSVVTRVAFSWVIAYSMSKGATDVLTRTLAKELGPRGITVNAVCPGITETGINPTLKQPETRARYEALSVFNRLGSPEDIADVVAFLSSDDARWVTGQCVDASGGLLLGI